MGFKDLFKDFFKSAPPQADPLAELTLSKLKIGYFVDYDLKSWQVTGYNVYDFSEGDKAHEWQLKSGEETAYLELESDDEDYWSLNRKIPFGSLGDGLGEHIQKHGDPPDKIELKGMTYHLEETAGGHCLKNGQEPGQEFLRWSFADESGKELLEIEQWGESDFEASAGAEVEEYQFTNILPGS